MAATSFRLTCSRMGQVIRIAPGESLTVGRVGGGADVGLPDMCVGRRQLRLTNSDGVLTLEDLRPRQSMLLNGERFPFGCSRGLKPGDRLDFRGYSFVVSPESALVTATQPPT